MQNQNKKAKHNTMGSPMATIAWQQNDDIFDKQNMLVVNTATDPCVVFSRVHSLQVHDNIYKATIFSLDLHLPQFIFSNFTDIYCLPDESISEEVANRQELIG